MRFNLNNEMVEYKQKGLKLKIIILLMFIFSSIFSKVYYSRVEPYEVHDISSDVMGRVLYTDENDIGKVLSDKAYIKIDSKLSVDELKSLNTKIKYISSTIEINKHILTNLKKALKKKRYNYKRIESLKVKSKVEKDKEFYDIVSSENLLLSTKKEINNLQIQLADLRFRKAQLQKDISDKNLRAKGFVLYSISVKAGQVVTKLTPLAKVADISKAILTIYVDSNILKNIKDKIVYINSKKTDYKVSRVLKVADSTNISKYMVQIIIKPPKIFSKLVKVELNDK